MPLLGLSPSRSAPDVSRLLGLVAAAVVALTLLCFSPAPARADIPSVFGGDIGCHAMDGGARFCGDQEPRATTPSFDGVPLDVDVAFPSAPPASGDDGPYPLLVLLGGYSSPKLPYGAMTPWINRGYAVLSVTDRGFDESCGTADARAAAAEACARGYTRLADARYEVRDVQYLAGRLADAGLIAPQRIGVVGNSYGGGIAMTLAALRDRVMLPDGSLVPWVSPEGRSMAIAAGAPVATWSDLAAALAPSGRQLDYIDNAEYMSPVGVVEQTLVDGLGGSCGLRVVFCADATEGLGASLPELIRGLDDGEPYGADVDATLQDLTAHHSAYGIDHSEPPAPEPSRVPRRLG